MTSKSKKTFPNDVNILIFELCKPLKKDWMFWTYKINSFNTLKMEYISCYFKLNVRYSFIIEKSWKIKKDITKMLLAFSLKKSSAIPYEQRTFQLLFQFIWSSSSDNIWTDMGRSLSASTSIKSARLPRLPRDDPEVVDEADDELALELTKGHKGL